MHFETNNCDKKVVLDVGVIFFHLGACTRIGGGGWAGEKELVFLPCRIGKVTKKIFRIGRGKYKNSVLWFSIFIRALWLTVKVTVLQERLPRLSSSI